MQEELEQAIIERLRRDEAVPGGGLADDRAIAAFIVVTINGLAASARFGISRADLDRSARMALSALPKAGDRASIGEGASA